jgi:hypothetical protein
VVPLTTHTGLSTAELHQRVRGRDVFVWGCGELALDVLTSLRKSGIEPRALLHSRASPTPAHGLPVCAADEVLDTQPGLFVVIATVAYGRQARAACLKRDLRADVDFVTQLSIARPHAVVEVVSDHAPRLMNLDSFARVVDKLGREIEQLCRLELALQGEPLRHPDLPTMIALGQRVAPCIVPTGLGGELPLRELVAAAPSRIDISVSGFGARYETRTGRPWDDFLRRLDELRDALRHRAESTSCQLKLYRLHGDSDELVRDWQRLLGDAPIALSVQTPYLMPYDRVLQRCESGSWPHAEAAALDTLPWRVDAVLEACARERDLPCLSQRVFPVIHADRAVGLCHLFDAPRIDDDFLARPWSHLLEQRHQSPFCTRCQAFGLHRLDLDVLTRRHCEIALFKTNADDTCHEH